jgi:hypothetical protein
MRRWPVALLLALAGSVAADETVRICYGYGCLVETEVRYSERQLGLVRRMLFATVDAEKERKTLAEVIGRLYAWAGEQSDIHNDRGGNYADDNVSGKMDCIDHSSSTTRLLEILSRRGYLRRHRVLAPAARNFAGLITVHWSAVIEEKTGGEAAHFVVDSWFVDNGQPAVILPLDEWKKGAGPDV